MDFLKDLIREKGGDMVANLMQNGFNKEQAGSFVPEAGQSVMDALTGGDGFDLEDLGKLSNISALMGKIDLGGLAAKVGIGQGQAKSGMESILPMLLGGMQEKAGALGGLASLLGGGGGLGALGGLAGKLFGK